MRYLQTTAPPSLRMDLISTTVGIPSHTPRPLFGLALHDVLHKLGRSAAGHGLRDGDLMHILGVPASRISSQLGKDCFGPQ